MREIKFRAWLKDKMEMCEVLMINFQKSYIGVKTKDYNIIQVGISWKYTQKVARFDDVELMQYTGLKDKNDVEIYEGDILQTDRYPGENYYIEIAVDEDPPHNFIYGWRKKPNATVRGISDGIYTILESERNFKDSEIIGNIFEDGDLIANR